MSKWRLVRVFSDGGAKVAAHRRKRGSGGVIPVREGVWRIDIEGKRDPVTGRRRRNSRHVHGTREEAELALAKLRVADDEKRLPSGGTNARSVATAFQQYLQAIDAGLIELAPSTVVTVRSAAKVMGAVQLADGRVFGAISLSRLTWQDVEHLYAAHAHQRQERRLHPAVRHDPGPHAGAGPQAWAHRLQPDQGRHASAHQPDEALRSFGGQVREVLERVKKADPEIGLAGVVFASTGPDHLAGPPAD